MSHTSRLHLAVLARAGVSDRSGHQHDWCRRWHSGRSLRLRDVNAQIAAIRALDMAAGGDERTHYYGLVSDAGFFMRGCTAGIPSSPSPSTVASGPTGPATWGWDGDGSYGDWYGGHELGHTYGRRHPGFCGETQSDLDNYPFDNGQLANSDASFAGFDVGDPVNGLPMAVLRGTQWHDVMTYCDLQWLSAYTYLGVRRRLADEDNLERTEGPVPAGLAREAVRTNVSRTMLRRKRCRRGGGRRRRPPRPEVIVSVVARVNLTKRTGRIEFVNPLERVIASDRERPGQRCCVLEASATRCCRKHRCLSG